MLSTVQRCVSLMNAMRTHAVRQQNRRVTC